MLVLRKMIKYLRICVKETIYSILIIIFTTIATVILPLMYKNIIDIGILNKNLKVLIWNLVFLVILTLFREIFDLLHTVVTSSIRTEVFSKIRVDIYKHLQEMSLSYYTSNQTGSLVSRIISDVDALENLLTEKFLLLFKNLLMIVMIIAIIFNFNYKVALMCFVFFPLFAMFFKMFTTTVYNMSYKVREKQEELMGSLQDGISGFETIQSYDVDKSNLKNTYEKIEETEHTKKMLNIKSAISEFSSVSISIFSMILLWGYGGYNVLNGKMSMGELIAISYYVNFLLEYTTNTFNIVINMRISYPAAKRVFDILDLEPEIRDSEDAVEIDDIQGNLVWKNVNFSYDKDKQILENVSVSFERGSFNAIVGESGQGKTSFIRLISRFYDPVEGDIYLDGMNLKDIKIVSLRKHIAVITQETFLFNSSIKDNIILGRKNISMGQIINAAKIANAHEFIMGLPEGYETNVGERGIKLSGGQKKRIAIARAILLDPKILILDEATADLDEATEKSILNGVKHISKDKVVFMITHRLSNLAFADRVFMVSNGNVTECNDVEGYNKSLNIE
ncbi:MAG: ABC transporter ATP-binding protein/permease [Maledivibacter sp.]|nr:ABC transporter ATP-binding protein/permease [Maledivibacter sp.]